MDDARKVKIVDLIGGAAGPSDGPDRRFLAYMPSFLHFYPGLSRDDFYALTVTEFGVLAKAMEEAARG